MNLCKQHAHAPIVVSNAHAHTYYILFAHVAKSINWPRNSLVSSPSLERLVNARSQIQNLLPP